MEEVFTVIMLPNDISRNRGVLLLNSGCCGQAAVHCYFVSFQPGLTFLRNACLSRTGDCSGCSHQHAPTFVLFFFFQCQAQEINFLISFQRNAKGAVRLEVFLPPSRNLAKLSDCMDTVQVSCGCKYANSAIAPGSRRRKREAGRQESPHQSAVLSHEAAKEHMVGQSGRLDSALRFLLPFTNNGATGPNQLGKGLNSVHVCMWIS